MLYNEHTKSAKDAQRKIAKLREENKDPSLPQNLPHKHTPAPPPVPGPSSSPTPQTGNRMVDSQNTGDESFMLLGQRVSPVLSHCPVHYSHNLSLNRGISSSISSGK